MKWLKRLFCSHDYSVIKWYARRGFYWENSWITKIVDFPATIQCDKCEHIIELKDGHEKA
jgi:hypothetical protein